MQTPTIVIYHVNSISRSTGRAGGGGGTQGGHALSPVDWRVNKRKKKREK